MTIATWPDDLPGPTTSGWSWKPEAPVMARKSSKGIYGQRRRFSAVATAMTLKLSMSANEAATLRNFWEYDCEMGGLPFYMPHPRDDGRKLADGNANTLQNGSGLDLVTSRISLCQWSSPPSETAKGLRFLLTLNLLILPR